MSPTPADVVGNLYAAFERGDIPALLGLIAEDIHWRAPENLPQGGDFDGRDGVGRFFQRLGESWEDVEVHVEDMVSGGDRVLVLARLRGRLRATGEQTGYSSVHAWTLRDGVPVRFDEYVDAPVGLPAAHAATA